MPNAHRVIKHYCTMIATVPIVEKEKIADVNLDRLLELSIGLIKLLRYMIKLNIEIITPVKTNIL